MDPRWSLPSTPIGGGDEGRGGADEEKIEIPTFVGMTRKAGVTKKDGMTRCEQNKTLRFADGGLYHFYLEAWRCERNRIVRCSSGTSGTGKLITHDRTVRTRNNDLAPGQWNASEVIPLIICEGAFVHGWRRRIRTIPADRYRSGHDDFRNIG